MNVPCGVPPMVPSGSWTSFSIENGALFKVTGLVSATAVCVPPTRVNSGLSKVGVPQSSAAVSCGAVSEIFTTELRG